MHEKMNEEQKNTPGQSVSVSKITDHSQLVNIGQLLTQAVDKNLPVETMERLVVLAEKMQAIKAKQEFDKALAAFQAECPVIEKRKRVSFGTTNYTYAPLEDIVQQVGPILAEHGFSYTFNAEEADKAIKITCYAKHIGGHSEPSSLVIEIDHASKMNKTQQYGSANSYGKRYAFCNAFGILTGDEDNDGQTNHVNPAHKPSPIQSKKNPYSQTFHDLEKSINSSETLEFLKDQYNQVKTLAKGKSITQLEADLLAELVSQKKAELQSKDLPTITVEQKEELDNIGDSIS